MKTCAVFFCAAVLLLLADFAISHDEKLSKGRVASVCTKNACVIEPEVTEGPYYYDTELVREDITEGMPGIQLNLTVNVLDIATCSPISKAAIDIWHCDASGVYSWFVNDQNPAPENSTFLRGILLTDSFGSATFKTIYPGWYVGRATHIHIKVHINGTDTNGLYTGGSVSLTSQLFFDDSISDQIYQNSLYSGEPTYVSRVLNSDDSIYNEMNGMGMLDITMMDPSQGYAGGVYGKITIVVDTTASSPGSSTGPGGATPEPSGVPSQQPRPSGAPSGNPPPRSGHNGAAPPSAPSGVPPPSGHPPRPSGAPSGVPPPPPSGAPSGVPPPSGHPPRPSGSVPPPPSGQPPRPSGVPSDIPEVPSLGEPQPSGAPSGQPPRPSVPSGNPSGHPSTFPSGVPPPRPSGNPPYPPSGNPPYPPSGSVPPPPSGEPSPLSSGSESEDGLIELANPEVASSASVLLGAVCVFAAIAVVAI